MGVTTNLSHARGDENECGETGKWLIPHWNSTHCSTPFEKGLAGRDGVFFLANFLDVQEKNIVLVIRFLFIQFIASSYYLTEAFRLQSVVKVNKTVSQAIVLLTSAERDPQAVGSGRVVPSISRQTGLSDTSWPC